MAKAMKLIRRCALLISACVLTACATPQLPVAPEAQPERFRVVQHVERNEVKPDFVSVSVDTEVQTNFALESIPKTSTSNNLTSLFKIPPSLKSRILNAVERNAYSDFPSRNDILAIMAIESSFNPKASNKGSLGLMQIRKKSHGKKIKGRSLFDVDVNIEVGAQVLREYYLSLNRNEKAAILAYNSGVGNYLKGRFRMEYYRKYKTIMLFLSNNN